MTRLMPKCVLAAAIASLTFVTIGCASKPAYETKVGDSKTQTEKVQKDAEAKIKVLEREIADTKEAAEKERKALADKIEGLERDLAASKEATAKAAKDTTDEIRALEGELTATKIETAKAEQAQKEAESKLKALEAKPASIPPADAKPAPK
jgi:chromosome segregation ATPase